MATVANEAEFKNAVSISDPEIIIANNINLTSPTNIGYALNIKGGPGVSIFWVNPTAFSPNMFIVTATGNLVIESLILDAGGRNGTLVRIIDGRFTMNSNVVLRNVVSTTSQHAVAVAGSPATPGGTFIMNGGLITEINEYEAVYVDGGSVVMNNDAAIRGNLGAAISMGNFVGITPRTSLTMTGRSLISNNRGKQPGGAGIFVGSDIIMGVNEGDAPMITDNQAPDFCGGLLLTGGSTLTMRYDAEISNNYAPQYAGGVVAQLQTVISMFGNSAIKNNRSDGHSGGLVLSTDSAILMDDQSQISGNTCTSSGGGVHLQKGSVLQMKGNASIHGNTGNEGAGIYLNASTATIGLDNSSPAIYNNNAAGGSRGGGIFATANSSLTITGLGSITGNSATAYGGGIYLDETVVAALSAQSRIADNTAGIAGKGVYNAGTLRISQNIQILDGFYFNSEATVPVIVQALGENASIQLESSEYVAPTNIPIMIATKGASYGALTESDIAAILIPASFPPGTPIYLDMVSGQLLLGLVVTIQGAFLTFVRIA